MNAQKIDFRVPEDIIHQIDADARREGTNRSTIARRILINHYDRKNLE